MINKPSHNDLPNIQGGEQAYRYHLVQDHYNQITAGSYQYSSVMSNYLGTTHLTSYNHDNIFSTPEKEATLNSISTGLLAGGLLSVNPDDETNTTFNLTAGIGNSQR